MKRHSDTRVLLVVLLLLGACAQEAGSPAGSAEPETSPPRFGGTLVRRLESDIVTLNPVLVGSRYDTYVHRYLFTPLVDLSAELQPVPALAGRWDISADRRDYTFYLEPKATFSDGTPVRASDVLFTLQKIVEPQSEAYGMAPYFDQLDMSRTRVVGPHTILVAFREALASQLLSFTNLLVLPEHVYSKGNFNTDYNAKPVGSGPYVLTRYVTGTEVVLARRDNYWAQKPYIETVHFKVIQSGATAWNAAKVGQLDETNVQSDVWLRERGNSGLQEKLNFVEYYGLAYNYIAWNGRQPLFSDKRMRRALAMCINVRDIISGLYGGTARVMTGHFLPGQDGFNPTVPAVEYDLEGARQLLTSLGWLDTNGDGVLDRGGKPLSFDLMITTGSATAQAIAQMMQADLKKAGVRMEIAVVDFAALMQRIMAGNYQAAYLSWDLDPDPDPFALFHSSQTPPRGFNFTFYANPEADRLIEQGRYEFDAGKRADLYRRLHAILAEDQPYAWTVQPTVKWVLNRRVRNARVGRGYGLFLWTPGELDWWLAGARPSLVQSQTTATTRNGE